MPHLVQTMAVLKHRLTELLQHLQCEKWSLHRHKADTLWVMWSYNLATVQGDPGSCFKVMQILCPQKLHSFTAWKYENSAATVPRIQDRACEVSEIFEDGCGVLQLQKLLFFVLEERKSKAEYDLWRKMA